MKNNGKFQCKCPGHPFSKQLWLSRTRAGRRTPDGFHSFCQPLPPGRFYSLQYGKLRNRQCFCDCPQKLSLSYGPPWFWTWVGSDSEKRRSEHGSALCRENRFCLQWPYRGSCKHSGFFKGAERKICNHGWHQSGCQLWFQCYDRSSYGKRRWCNRCLYRAASSRQYPGCSSHQ